MMVGGIAQCHWVFGGSNVMAAPRRVEKLLADLVRLLAMTAIAAPQVAVDALECRALQLIAESHVALHIWRAPAHAYVSVFSCREFDPARVEVCLRIWLGGMWAREQVRPMDGEWVWI